ncbi:MAG: M48 family metalloprotease [Candidatus Sedimenticola sp. PURPLELP]
MMTKRLLLGVLILALCAAGGAMAGPFDQFKSMLGAPGQQKDNSGNTRTIDLGNIFKSAKDAFGDVAPEEERAIGVESSSLLLGAVPLLQEAKLQYYINLVGNWVAQQTERPDLDWRFGILDTDDINSFAAPGGYVFITKGMLRQLDNEAELAAVLAHECAHVVQRHYLAAVQKNARLDLSANLVSAAVKTDQRGALDKVLSGSRELYARGLDKDDEYEADRMGAVLTARAGYEPFGLHHVMQRLAAVNPNDGSLSFLFKTHPSPDKRLDELEVTVDPLSDYVESPVIRRRFQVETSVIHRH